MSMESASACLKMTVSFKDHGGDLVLYKIKPDMKIMKMLKIYSEGKQLEYAALEFLHNGRRLPRRGTFAEAGVQDGDEIDVMRYRSGDGGGGGGPSKLVVQF